jgi:hypothetical protein
MQNNLNIDYMSLPKKIKFGLTNSQTKKIKEMDKNREPFLKKLNKCKTRKCSKQNKKRLAEQKRYLKEEKKQCSKIEDNSEYYDCTDKLYEKSKYKKLFDKWVKCGKTKCSKELERLNHE